MCNIRINTNSALNEKSFESAKCHEKMLLFKNNSPITSRYTM